METARLTRLNLGSFVAEPVSRFRQHTLKCSWNCKIFTGLITSSPDLQAKSLLAGFLVIPGTFTSLQTSSALEKSLSQGSAEKVILDTIQNPPLVAMAWLFLWTGAGLMVFLFLKWRYNYIWLTNRLFIPTFLNTIAGLVTTLINVYTAKDGYWSIMALLTVITSGVLAATSLTLAIIYQFWKLRLVKEEHDRETKAGLRLVNPAASERSSSPHPLGSSSTKREE